MHAHGLDPVAVLPFTVALDFEGDQWTFFKPPHQELRDLYGVDVQELNVWRPLVEHAVQHLRDGKLISTEADAFWLPDTAGTDYQRQHTKTTIVLQDIDLEARRLGYFHNAGYHALEGEDFAQTFRLDAAARPHLHAAVRRARADRSRLRAAPADELAAMSRDLLRKHHARRPAGQPGRALRRSASDGGPAVDHEQGLPFYHAWAFATVRQLGAAFELAAFHLRWLDSSGEVGYAPAAASFTSTGSVSQSACKAFILKGARAVRNKKPLDAGIFDEMAAAWDLEACGMGSPPSSARPRGSGKL